MARKLYIDLSVEQMRTLNEAARRLSEETSGEESVRWRAIARESSRALDSNAARGAGPSEERCKVTTGESESG